MSYPNLNKDDILNLDRSNMFKTLSDFPAQITEAISIGNNAPTFPQKFKSSNFLVLGMGGSAIGGDILSSYLGNLEGAGRISVKANRDYSIPGYIDENYSIIASSYSGGTEETIEGLQKALEVTQNIVCITTGGKLGEIADANKLPRITVPGGFMPRCALAYSFFPMLLLLKKSGAFDEQTAATIDSQLTDTLSFITEKSGIYSQMNEENPAYALAIKLYDTVPVVYSSNKLDSVNLRWRCQIQENAKNLAFGSVLPEMNHNEINAWSYPQNSIHNFSIVLLRDESDHTKVQTRFNAIQEILGEHVQRIIPVSSKGTNFMSRMFDLIYLGDWVSYYLALLNGVDPTPIPLISKLKNLLSQLA